MATIPKITEAELDRATRQMAKGKCGDASGVFMEMVRDGGSELRRCLADAYNGLLKDGFSETGWQETLFVVLPKAGDLTDPANWRPIAVLKVC